MKISKIKILDCFKEHPPKKRKLNDKKNYLNKNGVYESPIIIDEYNILEDGYTTYILSHFHNVEPIIFRRIGNRLYEEKTEFES